MRKGLSRRILEYSAAYHLQAKAFGGLSRSLKRQLAKCGSKSRAGNGRSTALRTAKAPPPGSRLVREWHGASHTVIEWSIGFERHVDVSCFRRHAFPTCRYGEAISTCWAVASRAESFGSMVPRVGHTGGRQATDLPILLVDQRVVEDQIGISIKCRSRWLRAPATIVICTPVSPERWPAPIKWSTAYERVGRGLS